MKECILKTPDKTVDKRQIMILRSRREEILQEVYADSIAGGYLDVMKTAGKLRKRFYWLNCTDVKE